MNEKIKNDEIDESTGFTELVNMNYLNGKNCTFSFDGTFLTLVSDIDVDFSFLSQQEDDVKPEPHFAHAGPPGRPPMHMGQGMQEARDEHGIHFAKKREKKYVGTRRDYGRVFLHRAFPFEEPYRYLSVQDEFGNEIGMISDISDFDEKTRENFKVHLEKRYFSPKIIKIFSVKERFGYSYWNVECDCGKKDIVIRDPYRSIVKMNEDRLYITDSDGTRYEIESLSSLEKKSLKKIELYL